MITLPTTQHRAESWRSPLPPTPSAATEVCWGSLVLALTAHLWQDRVSGCLSVGGGLSGRDVGMRRVFLRLQWAQAKAPPWVSIPTWGARSPHGSRAGTATHSLARVAPTAASTPHTLLTVLLTNDVHGCPPWALPCPAGDTGVYHSHSTCSRALHLDQSFTRAISPPWEPQPPQQRCPSVTPARVGGVQGSRQKAEAPVSRQLVARPGPTANPLRPRTAPTRPEAAGLDRKQEPATTGTKLSRSPQPEDRHLCLCPH